MDILAAFDPSPGRPAGAGRYVLLDVFTDRQLEGNQLAVFPDARGVSDERMQRMASEVKLSESVFVLPPEQDGEVAIRIFTPTAEMPFAGHPVLGAAIVVASALEREEVTLETRAGPVTVRVRRERGAVVSGWMSQPVPTWRAYESQGELLQALGVSGSSLPIEVYDNGPSHLFVALEDAQAVTALAPDLYALAALGEMGVSCFAGGGRHWKTRMFAPGLGVSEDPATGSAAGPLAVHLARHGWIELGSEIEISQGIEIGRPSLLYAYAEGSEGRIEGVHVGGSAVMVGRGELLLG
ncbi:MAG: PhzF family phenazine biosynthesis protein [Solirubrobacteraceae bacterium]